MKWTATRWADSLLWVFSGLVILQTFSLILWYWPGALPDGPTSGVWTSLAYDFSKGIFYRPLMDETGYGGTRYMPLFFVLHGILIRLFDDPLTTGIFLTLLSSLFLNIGLYFVLRSFNLPAHIAFAFAVAINATISYQLTTLNIRGDFLAAAFNIWGIWFAIRHKRLPSPANLALAGLFFVLAFLTKLTTVFGLLAVIPYFWFSGPRPAALKLFWGTALGYFLSLLAIHILSDGRALESFLACATGGMENTSPFRFIFHFFNEVLRDPIFFVLFALTLILFIASARNFWKELPFLFFSTTFIFTLFIFSSPGTTSNHFIDLGAAMMLLLALHFSRNPAWAKTISLAFPCISAYIILSWFPPVPSIKKTLTQNQKPTLETVAYFYKRYGQKASPVLSHFTLFSILHGERPFAGDLFNLSLLTKKYPEIKKDFERKIKDQFFGSIVTANWPVVFAKDIESRDDPDFAEKAAEYHRQQRGRFGGFYELIQQYYEISSVRRPFVFYSPRGSTQPSP